jgi:hypothetical protein
MRRKNIRPKTGANPLMAIMPMSPDERDAQMCKNFDALDAMSTSVGATIVQWAVISTTLNTVCALIDMGEIDPSHQDAADGCMFALNRAAERYYTEQQPVRMEAPEVQGVRDLLTLYHACLERKTEMVILRAKKLGEAKIQKLIAERKAAAKTP